MFHKIQLESPDQIIFDKDNEDLQLHITRDIWNDNSKLIIGKKKSYLLYHGSDYKMLGYLHSMSYSLDVIRSQMAKHITKGNQYEIHVKKVVENKEVAIKFYLYEKSQGWIYNGLTLLDKFKIIEIPKIDIKYK